MTTLCFACRSYQHLLISLAVYIGSYPSQRPRSPATMGVSRQRKALVVGAGPVGALTALSLHRRGWEVEIWESREGESHRVVLSGLTHH